MPESVETGKMNLSIILSEHGIRLIYSTQSFLISDPDWSNFGGIM